MRIEDLLLQNKNCTQKDIEQAYSIQKEYGGYLGNILLNLGVISDEILVDTLCKQYKLNRFKKLEDQDIKKITLKDLSTHFFIQNKIFPLYETDDYLALATNNPFQAAVFSIIKQQIGKDIKLYLATDEELKEFKAIYETSEDEDQYDIFEDEVDRLKELASEAPIIKLVNNIFAKAVESYVSDIHFESYKNGMKVRFRLDGMLKRVDLIPNKLKQSVTARLKLISKMNISESRLPQDGRISMKVSGQEIDIRASSVPTAFGESFVLRLLGNDSVDLNLEAMGFHNSNLTLLKEMLKSPNGILLTTGPTGSGKTSTLYAALNYIYSEDIKIITVEDPVEYQLEGISQIQVKHSIDYSFANALRSILRQDPDVIMIGEIRDAQTAQIAVQAALTGHLVLSTLHTNSAVGAIARLLDMGIEYFLLKSSIVGLMAQRLTRRLCTECKGSIELTDEMRKLYDIDYLEQFIEAPLNPCKPVGCPKCNNSGYKGRMPILEVVPFNEKIIKKIDENRDFKDIRSLGYRTLKDDAILKFLEGHISLDEVVRLT